MRKETPHGNMNAAFLFPLLGEKLRHLKSFRVYLSENRSESGSIKPEGVRSALPPRAGRKISLETVRKEKKEII